MAFFFATIQQRVRGTELGAGHRTTCSQATVPGAVHRTGGRTQHRCRGPDTPARLVRAGARTAERTQPFRSRYSTPREAPAPSRSPATAPICTNAPAPRSGVATVSYRSITTVVLVLAIATPPRAHGRAQLAHPPPRRHHRRRALLRPRTTTAVRSAHHACAVAHAPAPAPITTAATEGARPDAARRITGVVGVVIQSSAGPGATSEWVAAPGPLSVDVRRRIEDRREQGCQRPRPREAQVIMVLIQDPAVPVEGAPAPAA